MALSVTPWTLSPATGVVPRRCPSPLLSTLREGWLPPGLSPLLEAWVAAGRTGWMRPLPLGVEGGTWRFPGGRRHRCTHLVPEPSAPSASSSPQPRPPAMGEPAEPRNQAKWDPYEKNISAIR